jgi:hypothetical protein
MRAGAAALFLVVLVSCGGVSARAVPATGVRVEDPLHLSVSYRIDSCRDLDHVEVAYGRSALTVTVFAVPNKVPCGLVLPRSVAVPLREPLGNREILDGA